MKPISVVIANILIDAITSFSKTIVVVAPDFFFFDRADDAFDVGVVIRCIVARVLTLDPVFGKELDEVFGAGLGSVVATQNQPGARFFRRQPTRFQRHSHRTGPVRCLAPIAGVPTHQLARKAVYDGDKVADISITSKQLSSHEFFFPQQETK